MKARERRRSHAPYTVTTTDPPIMTDARILPHPAPFALPLSASHRMESQPCSDELSDADLEQVVGGLARMRDDLSAASPRPDVSFTIAVTPAHDIISRVSA